MISNCVFRTFKWIKITLNPQILQNLKPAFLPIEFIEDTYILQTRNHFFLADISRFELVIRTGNRNGTGFTVSQQ